MPRNYNIIFHLIYKISYGYTFYISKKTLGEEYFMHCMHMK